MINLYMTMNMKEKIYYLLFAVLMALFCTACNEEWTDEQYEHYVSFKAPMDYARGVTDIYVKYKLNGAVTYQLPVIMSGSTLPGHDTEVQIAILPGYTRYWNSADKAGYSGTAVFTRQTPLNVTCDFGADIHRHEGRVITAEYPEFYLVCCYTPNSKDQLSRLDYRMEWEDDLRDYLHELDAKKPVVYCGDLNVAHEEIDIKNPKSNRMNPGFSDEERAKMTQLLESGFTDTFRYLYPDKTGAYSWWSYRFNARKNNAGWRIDYFIVSDRLRERIKSADIWSEVMGSDHCPVVLELDI